MNHKFTDASPQSQCMHCGNTRPDLRSHGFDPDDDQCLGSGEQSDAPMQRDHKAAIGRMTARKVEAERVAADVERDDAVRRQMRHSIMNRKWGE